MRKVRVLRSFVIRICVFSSFFLFPIFILLDDNREAAEGAAARRGPKDKLRSSEPSEGQKNKKTLNKGEGGSYYYPPFTLVVKLTKVKKFLSP